MASEKIKCRECGLCCVETETCGLTGRKITLDSLRKCKKGLKKSVIENAERH